MKATSNYCSPFLFPPESLMIRKKRQQHQQQLVMMDLTQNGILKNVSLLPSVRLSWRSLFMYVRAACPPLIIFLVLCHLARVFLLISSDVWLSHWCSEVQRIKLNQSQNEPEGHAGVTQPSVSIVGEL